MDEITRAFKIARAHFDNTPVWSDLYLLYSKEYQPYHFADDVAWFLRFARKWDSQPVIRWNSSALWKDILEHSVVVWKKKT